MNLEKNLEHNPEYDMKRKMKAQAIILDFIRHDKFENNPDGFNDWVNNNFEVMKKFSDIAQDPLNADLGDQELTEKMLVQLGDDSIFDLDKFDYSIGEENYYRHINSDRVNIKE